MKKLSLIFISLLLLFNILPSNLAFASSNSNDVINTTLKQYFSNTLQVQKEIKPIKNIVVESNSDLEKYRDLHSQLIVDWSTITEEKVTSYSVNVVINSIEEKDNLLRIDVDNVVNLKYKDTDFDSSYTENHIIYLKKISNKYFVSKDIFEIGAQAKDVEYEINNTDGGYDTYIKNKISDLSNKITTVSEDAKKFKADCESKNSQFISNRSITTYSTSYNGQAAANWAYNNVYSSEDYPDADCTNFVSKAINYGGISTDDIWFQDSYAWIRVIDLRNWLLNTGNAQEYSSYSYAQIGDIIQYYNKSKAQWTHSVIVTARDNWSSYPYVCAHSAPQRNVLASYYYPNGSTFSNYRVLDVR